ncbi:MAG TPA: PAS domain S-box protein [Candidatus Limnocylindria bacterium]|nr:PAS domain S-box protein [Candidatus Limnocylindria bacterium]
MPERFSHLFEQLPEALLILGRDGLIANANEAAAALYAARRDDLLGRKVLELWSADDQTSLLNFLDALTERGDLTLSGEGRRLDGRRFPQEMRLTVDHDSQAARAFVVVRDLSARQRLESGLAGLADLARLNEQQGNLGSVAARALRLSRRMLRADRGAVCVFTGGRVEWLASHRLERLITAADGVSPDDVPWLRRALQSGRPELHDRRRPERMRSPLSTAADALGVVAFAIVPVRTDEELSGVLGLVWSGDPPDLALDRDLLAAIGRLIGLALANVRLRDSLFARQQALDESEERYRSLFEQAPEPILLQARDGLVLDANRAACGLFGRRRRELLGRRTDELAEITDDDRARLRGQLRRRRRGSVRGRGVRPDGSSFPFVMHIAATTLRGEERLLAQLRDLTEQERMQAELLQAQKMEALGQLISGVAHELNNPLSAIVAFSQLLRSDERLPADLVRDADLLMQEADRTRRIVQNLLDFARQRPPERQPASLKTLVERTLELHSYALRAGSISVLQDIPDTLPPVDVDPGQIQQVLLNLTLNAIQAIRSAARGGTLSISAGVECDEAGQDRVRLTIADDGPGVSASVQPHLFEPFFTTKAIGEGTGLGLSVSYGIVAAHAGRLFHEAGEGGGATFILELPAGEAVEGRPLEAPPLHAPLSGQRADGSRGPLAESTAVLAVDDEPAVRGMLERALTRGGYRVGLAASGEEALVRLAAETFDLLLVDHRMGGMDGLEFVRRAVAARPELGDRIVIMSGDTNNASLRAFAASSGTRLLAKPFDVVSLLTVVDEEVERTRVTVTAGTPPP